MSWGTEDDIDKIVRVRISQIRIKHKAEVKRLKAQIEKLKSQVQELKNPHDIQTQTTRQKKIL